MGLVTSHAPSVLRRIHPELVRHFRLDLQHLVTTVRPIRLPEDDEEAAKFVRQAVLARPEIYFANLVILGEGDSEEVVIPRVAKALGIDLDPSFIAFAPLGGRHVNHFWRLLNDLCIPFLTLLDLDLGRYGAGPLRLKYAYDQLNALAPVDAPAWAGGDPTTAAYWQGRRITRWRSWFADRKVFFSFPLDLDMMMLRSFPNAYGVGEDEPDDEEALKVSIFGKGVGPAAFAGIVQEEDRPTLQELETYDLLFKQRGKPGSHLTALAQLTDQEITANCPQPLRDLIESAKSILAEPGDDNEAEA
jgi:putative ATP-dependent endonuclease of OLD family